MSLTIDELSQSSCYRKRTSHATPARRHHTGVGPLRAIVFAPGLAFCATATSGRNAGSSFANSNNRYRLLRVSEVR
jgi:hypothetical protein